MEFTVKELDNCVKYCKKNNMDEAFWDNIHIEEEYFDIKRGMIGIPLDTIEINYEEKIVIEINGNKTEILSNRKSLLRPLSDLIACPSFGRVSVLILALACIFQKDTRIHQFCKEYPLESFSYYKLVEESVRTHNEINYVV